MATIRDNFADEISGFKEFKQQQFIAAANIVSEKFTAGKYRIRQIVSLMLHVDSVREYHGVSVIKCILKGIILRKASVVHINLGVNVEKYIHYKNNTRLKYLAVLLLILN